MIFLSPPYVFGNELEYVKQVFDRDKKETSMIIMSPQCVYATS